jgi:hypothetical protein
MSSQFEGGLQNPENGDFDHKETGAPAKSPRVVVSVAFQKQDFATVSERAGRVGKKTSEFIRDAALEKATGRGLPSEYYPTGNSGSIWIKSDLPPVTRAFTSVIHQKSDEPVLTSS